MLAGDQVGRSTLRIHAIFILSDSDGKKIEFPQGLPINFFGGMRIALANFVLRFALLANTLADFIILILMIRNLM